MQKKNLQKQHIQASSSADYPQNEEKTCKNMRFQQVGGADYPPKGETGPNPDPTAIYNP